MRLFHNDKGANKSAMFKMVPADDGNVGYLYANTRRWIKD